MLDHLGDSSSENDCCFIGIVGIVSKETGAVSVGNGSTLNRD